MGVVSTSTANANMKIFLLLCISAYFIQTALSAPEPLDTINIHLNMGDLLEEDGGNAAANRGGAGPVNNRGYGDRTEISNVCQDVNCTGKRTTIAISCCDFGRK